MDNQKTIYVAPNGLVYSNREDALEEKEREEEQLKEYKEEER